MAMATATAMAMAMVADTDGREDMKRIFGITAVEERGKHEKGVKVQPPIVLYFLQANSL